MTEKTKKEGIDLSTDIYVRASVIGKLINFLTNKKDLKILDVGGYQGKLEIFTDFPVQVLDIFDVKEKNYIKGNAKNINFPDNYFDVVTSIETLEHIEGKDRKKVLEELVRVSKDLVIVSCPVLTDENINLENFASDFFKKQTGSDHPWLKEHKEYSLPQEELVFNVLSKKLKSLIVIDNDPAIYWLEMILLHFFDIVSKEQYSDEIKNLYGQFNTSLALQKPRKPIYRKIFVGRKKKDLEKNLDRIVYTGRNYLIKKWQFNRKLTRFFIDYASNFELPSRKFIDELRTVIRRHDPIEDLFFYLNFRTIKAPHFIKIKFFLPIKQILSTTFLLAKKISRKLKTPFSPRFIYAIKFLMKLLLPKFLERQARFNLAKRNALNGVNEFNFSYDRFFWTYFSGVKKTELENFNYNPKISIIVPVYNTDEKSLKKAINSVLKQRYNNWELCISDDASKEETKKVLKEFVGKDPRIKIVFRKDRGGISTASNQALELATGEFIGLLDHDDEISPNALYEVVKTLNEKPDTDFIYSDEDKIDKFGTHCDPYFKPDWSPDTVLSNMYTTHLSVYRKKLVDSLGGFRVGYEGSQDYDLVLRLTEKTDKIVHIPKILYHWRKITGSTSEFYHAKGYAHENARKAVTDAISRRGVHASVEQGLRPDLFRVHYEIKNQEKVSIIIPTKDKLLLLEKCISSILEKTTYNNYEILIVDNNSIEEKTKKYFQRIVSNPRVKVLVYNKPFNYSAVNNFAAKKTKAKYLLFLNNDTEILDSGWLPSMIELAQRKEVGIVGAKLLYPEGYIQHAGVVLGIGGIAGHAQKMFPDKMEGPLPIFNSKDMIRNWSCVTAACLMMRKSVFEKVGGFDETFRVAFNDVDLCLRVRKKGYLVVYTPYAKLVHHESASVGLPGAGTRDLAEFLNENEMMKKRWGDLLTNDPYYNPNLTLEREDFSLRLLDSQSVVGTGQG